MNCPCRTRYLIFNKLHAVSRLGSRQHRFDEVRAMDPVEPGSTNYEMIATLQHVFLAFQLAAPVYVNRTGWVIFVISLALVSVKHVIRADMEETTANIFRRSGQHAWSATVHCKSTIGVLFAAVYVGKGRAIDHQLGPPIRECPANDRLPGYVTRGPVQIQNLVLRLNHWPQVSGQHAPCTCD